MNPPPPATAVGKPYVRIVEEPAKCAIRFRYECEGRSAGSIPGVNSTPENKTYPTIQVCNYRGKAVVVVSCVTKDPPYRPHPHNLVGKEGCKKGVCTIVINENNADMTCTFTSLGIQCVKRKDIEESLKLRELIKVDPFRTGFSHRSQASSIDLNVVRLCFQVFIEGPEKGKFTLQLVPVVSEPIYDKKAMAELIITKLSHYSATCTGGKEIILLCDRVAKDDVQVRFFQVSPDKRLVWESFGEFLPNDVHKQVAISLRTPKFYDESIQQPVTIQVQLRRPSDGCVSLSRNFQITPKELDPDGVVRKRPKRVKEENYDLLHEYMQLSNTNLLHQPKLDGTNNELPVMIAQPSQPLTLPANANQTFTFSDFGQGLATKFVQVPVSFTGYNQLKPEMMAAPSTAGFMINKQRTDAPQFTIAQPQPIGSPNYGPQYSPNPSSASYSNVPSPAGMAHINSPTRPADNPPAELPNDVMERFDSLDIDSSELIPDLDLNSSTMLNLMMDTSSGLSLSDSFSEFSNPNQRSLNRSKLVNSLNANAMLNGSLSNSTNNNFVSKPSTSVHKNDDKIKLKVDNTNNNLSNGNASNAEMMDTPTLEMINAFSCGMDNSNIDDILQVLDVDNNNVL